MVDPRGLPATGGLARAGLDVPCVSVNLSPINFQNRGLAAVVAETLAANGLPPEALMLEITESVLMNERSVAIETMNAIRELGVGLSLDDFGTGYSSLSRLAHLPIRELKIDRSFMRDIESDASALAVASAVVRFGQALKMTVVAEGVETEGQRDVLKALGCDVVQGYLLPPRWRPRRSNAGCSIIRWSRPAPCSAASASRCRSRVRRCSCSRGKRSA